MNIILGVSGSIAAYKSAALTRLFVKAGAEVRVLLTPSATQFVGPLTFSTLSKYPVVTDINDERSWNNHVELGLWADAMIVAPATANTLAKMANGFCDNLLTATYLSSRCPVAVAPAMDLDMWRHSATQDNIRKLTQAGTHIIPVGFGELASGLVGDGRMAEPEDILAFTLHLLAQKADFKGKKALVTAGPTYEALDPVRFIGNHSTGKMGIAIADELARRGAEVDLVLGPSSLSPQQPGVNVHRVQSAQQMYEACLPIFERSDITVLAAAVADYRPKTVADQKIKKKDDDMQIELARTVDIAATLGAAKKTNQIMVGFALETNDEIAHAQRKIETKNLDAIVLNSLRDAGAGFGHDTNKITILRRDGTMSAFDLRLKTEAAKDIVDEIKRISGN